MSNAIEAIDPGGTHWARYGLLLSFHEPLVRTSVEEHNSLSFQSLEGQCVRTATGPGSRRGQPAWGGGCDRINRGNQDEKAARGTKELYQYLERQEKLVSEALPKKLIRYG